MSASHKRVVVAALDKALRTAPTQRTPWHDETLAAIQSARELIVTTVSVKDAGAKGGSIVKERMGSDFYRDIGRRGGQATSEKFGSEHFAEMGAKGGKAVKTRLGPDHYSAIGKKGGARVRELIAAGKEAQRSQPE